MRVLRQFRIVFNAVKTHFRQVERDAGIGGAQLWALSVIQSTPDIGMNGLSRALDIHQSTASNLIKGLIERGLMATVRSSTDRRAVTLRILPAGSAILDKAPAPFSVCRICCRVHANRHRKHPGLHPHELGQCKVGGCRKSINQDGVQCVIY